MSPESSEYSELAAELTFEKAPSLYESYSIYNRSEFLSDLVPEKVVDGWKFFIRGEPGVGKTGLMSEIAELASGNFPVLLYDNSLSSMNIPPDKMTPKNWAVLNARFYEMFQNVRAAEGPAVGLTVLKNRVVTAFEDIAKDIADGVTPDVFIISIIPNRLIQLSAGLQRESILETDDPIKVFDILDRNNTRLEGLEQTPENGLEIQQWTRRMGMIEHIRRIRREELNKASQWSAEVFPKLGRARFVPVDPPPVTKELVGKIFDRNGIGEFNRRDETIEEFIKDTRDDAMLLAEYTDYYFTEQLKLPKKNFAIVYTPFRESQSIIYFPYVSKMKKEDMVLSEPAVPEGRIKYIGFDMDGTLIDTMPGAIEIFVDAIVSEYNISEEKVRNFFIATLGTPTPDQVDRLIAGEGKMMYSGEAITLGQSIDRDISSLPAETFPEVIEMLTSLKKKGYKMFVSSSHMTRTIDRKLAEVGIRDFFDFIIGKNQKAREFTKGKPHFQATAKYFNLPYDQFISQVVFVGDAIRDILTATEAEVTAIGRVGVHDAMTLMQSGAAFALDDLSTLPDRLLEL